MNPSNYPLYKTHQITDLRDMLSKSVEMYGERPAFWVRPSEGQPFEPVSYMEFNEDVHEMCAALLNLGMKDKKVAVVSENRYEWPITYLAAVFSAKMVVPIDKELPRVDIHTLLNTAEVGCVVYSSKLSECVKEWNLAQENPAILINMDIPEDAAGELSFARALDKGKELLKSGFSLFDDVAADPTEAKILLFTSGTTATPKGVLLSQHNIATNLMAMCQMIDIFIDDIFLSVLPLHHTYECTCGFLCPIYRGASVAYCDGLKYVAPNLKEVKATVVLSVPAMFETMYRRLWATARKNKIEGKLKTGLKISGLLSAIGVDMRHKLFAQIHENFGGRVRLFISGAAGIDPVISKGFRNLGINFLQGYGITECSPIVALNRDKHYRDDAGGLTMPCMDIKLINRDEDGIGEIACRGGNVMVGYYRDEEATAAAFEDGWFKTGDLAKIDKEGFVIITGREKNVIVTKNGKNIYPEELETLVGRRQEIAECMVFGEYDEGSKETTICIQVLPNSDYIREAHGEKSRDEIKKIIEDIIHEVNRGNVLYKYIRKVYLRDVEFAKTTTKKIKRHAQSPLA